MGGMGGRKEGVRGLRNGWEIQVRTSTELTRPNTTIFFGSFHNS